MRKEGEGRGKEGGKAFGGVWGGGMGRLGSGAVKMAAGFL